MSSKDASENLGSDSPVNGKMVSYKRMVSSMDNSKIVIIDVVRVQNDVDRSVERSTM